MFQPVWIICFGVALLASGRYSIVFDESDILNIGPYHMKNISDAVTDKSDIEIIKPTPETMLEDMKRMYPDATVAMPKHSLTKREVSSGGSKKSENPEMCHHAGCPPTFQQPLQKTAFAPKHIRIRTVDHPRFDRWFPPEIYLREEPLHPLIPYRGNYTLPPDVLPEMKERVVNIDTASVGMLLKLNNSLHKHYVVDEEGDYIPEDQRFTRPYPVTLPPPTIPCYECPTAETIPVIATLCTINSISSIAVAIYGAIKIWNKKQKSEDLMEIGPIEASSQENIDEEPV